MTERVDVLWLGYDTGNDGSARYWVVTPDGTALHDQDPDLSFADLAELAERFKVAEWRPYDGEDLDTYDTVRVIGWAEALIARDDVERSYHTGHSGDPMVNVKVYDTKLPTGDEWAGLVDEHDLDPRLAALPTGELRELVDRYLEDNPEVFWVACEDKFELIAEDARDHFFDGYPHVKVWSAGRSGGWAVVEGLPDVSQWDPDLLGAWHDFEQHCRAAAGDIPYQMAWHVLANRQDELAGRVHVVELRLVLSDADLEAGDPATDWDWRGMLGLSVDSTITVTKKEN